MHKTSFKQFQILCQQSQHVVVSKEIYGDLLTPIRVFQALAKGCEEAALLDSSDHSNAVDACIYMGFEPIAEFRAKDGKSTITYQQQTSSSDANPFDALRDFYRRFKCESVHKLGKFAGGMIGFMGYDSVRYIEHIPNRHVGDPQLPDLCFMFYRTNIVFDKRSGNVLISKVVEAGDDVNATYQQAMHDIDVIIDVMVNAHAAPMPTHPNLTANQASINADIDDAAFADMVTQAKHYIRQGDAFQIVPSRCFKRAYNGDDFNIYRALKVLNPSPYQFYIRHRDYTLVGSSPERLVSLQQGVVETMPIAGTRPRGATRAVDVANEDDLIHDDKELAEHMMLVDLGRNDLGAVCQPGSIRLEEFKSIKRFSRVMHIVSRIQGLIHNDKDAFDVIKAVFPAGTLSGAPKIRAMEIIDELETTRRGAYGGAVVAIDNQGQMDSCITIRTALVKDKVATVRAGAGVVLDSDPKKEADETRYKAQAVMDALCLAEEGFV